jgi:hypothetical protein
MLNSRDRYVLALPTFVDTMLTLLKLLLITIYSLKSFTDSRITIILSENMLPSVSEKSQNKISIWLNLFATLEELLPLLILSLKPKEKLYLESLLLVISQHSIKLWLWVSFKLKVSILLEMP